MRFQLRQRIAKLDEKLCIKDDANNKRWFIDSIINGKRYHSESRYVRCSKEDALEKIKSKKENKIKELTIYFE